jgi:hypothetical protein
MELNSSPRTSTNNCKNHYDILVRCNLESKENYNRIVMHIPSES